MLRRWLLKSAPGVESLRHMSPDLQSPSTRTFATQIRDKDSNKQLLITRTLPQISGLLPQGAEILLDLRWGEASLHHTGTLSLACHCHMPASINQAGVLSMLMYHERSEAYTAGQ